MNTDETLDVPLARGKMDEANNLAEKGLWTRDLETLETMTPLSLNQPTTLATDFMTLVLRTRRLRISPKIRAPTEKFLEKAAINYGKAIDANPGEKLFADPQNRIETAVEHYKRLQGGGATLNASADTAPAASSASPSKSSAPSKSSGAGSKSTAATASKTSASSGASTPTSAASKVPAKAPASAAPGLTNAQIIKMAKAGVDEDNIVGTIRDAPSVQFDLSPDGLVNLASNGVKGKIVAAMRDRAKKAGSHPAS